MSIIKRNLIDRKPNGNRIKTMSKDKNNSDNLVDDRGVKIDKAKAIKLFPDLVLMTDLFAACIETQTLPMHGSPCHRLVRKFVEDSGIKPKRKRRPLPPVKSKEGQK